MPQYMCININRTCMGWDILRDFFYVFEYSWQRLQNDLIRAHTLTYTASRRSWCQCALEMVKSCMQSFALRDQYIFFLTSTRNTERVWVSPVVFLSFYLFIWSLHEQSDKVTKSIDWKYFPQAVPVFATSCVNTNTRIYKHSVHLHSMQAYNWNDDM